MTLDAAMLIQYHQNTQTADQWYATLQSLSCTAWDPLITDLCSSAKLLKCFISEPSHHIICPPPSPGITLVIVNYWLSSWPWKSRGTGWTELNTHSWSGQIIATWSTSNKPNVESLLGSMSFFLWPVRFQLVLPPRHQEKPVALSKQFSSIIKEVPSFMHLK